MGEVYLPELRRILRPKSGLKAVFRWISDRYFEDQVAKNGVFDRAKGIFGFFINKS